MPMRYEAGLRQWNVTANILQVEDKRLVKKGETTSAPQHSGMLTLNKQSVKPDLTKNQIIYIRNKEGGIMIVDAQNVQEVRNTLDGTSVTMHFAAYRHNHPGVTSSEAVVLGAACQGGQVKGTSRTFNEAPGCSEVVPEHVLKALQKLYGI